MGEVHGSRVGSATTAALHQGRIKTRSSIPPSLGKQNSSRWELHGLNPTWKSIKKTCGLLSEREGVVPSPYCKLNVGEFQICVSDFPDIEHGEGGGPCTLLSATLLGETRPVTWVVTDWVSPERHAKDFVYPPWPVCWVSYTSQDFFDRVHTPRPSLRHVGDFSGGNQKSCLNALWY